MEKQIRPYQIKAKEAVHESLNSNIRKQLLVMATGTGKTFTCIQIAESLNPRSILWITHEEGLLSQSAVAFIRERSGNELANEIDKVGYINWIQNHSGGLFSHASDVSYGAIKADCFEPNAHIVFASAQTLWRRLDKLRPDQFDLIVCDEAHLFGATTFVKSLNYFNPNLLLGLTATPFRQDGMMMGDIFDKIIFTYDILDAIKDGYLCELDGIRVRTDLSLDKVRTTAGEFNQGDLSKEINIPERNKLIVESYKKYADGRQSIVFCVDVQHALAVNSAFLEAGYTSSVVVGDAEITPDRRKIIDAYKRGETQILCNVMVLTAGFDHPDTGCVIHASPTKSKTKYLQATGRGTRLKSADFVSRFGQNCIIMDMVDSTSRHSLVNSYTLDKDEEDPFKRVFLTTEKREKILEARRQRSGAKIETTRAKDEYVNLLKLPKTKISDSIRMQEPATDKQLAWIKSLGYDTDTQHYTKAMCSQIISNLDCEQWQLNFLRDNGYDISNGATRSQYAEVKKKIEEQKAIAQANFNASQVKSPFSDL